MGQVGTRIVAETIYRLMEENPDSPLRNPRGPGVRIPGCAERPVKMWQLLDYAGVVNPLGGNW